MENREKGCTQNTSKHVCSTRKQAPSLNPMSAWSGRLENTRRESSAGPIPEGLPRGQKKRLC